ncbi:hypothetical protein HZA87_03005 [Candidatus Uhrbacteria bacterium]|nr:hypothetical protein [Candidatus Uhrbacteria bacterium]
MSLDDIDSREGDKQTQKGQLAGLFVWFVAAHHDTPLTILFEFAKIPADATFIHEARLPYNLPSYGGRSAACLEKNREVASQLTRSPPKECGFSSFLHIFKPEPVGIPLHPSKGCGAIPPCFVTV